MAPSKRHAPPASRASPDPAARGTPSPPAKGDKKASSGKSAANSAEKGLDDASPVPAVAKRARSRGGRRMTPPEEPKKEATSPPEDDKNAKADALHWGRQKARGAEPVKGGGAYGQTVEADAADAADVSARANAPAALVGKAALLASSRDAAPTVLYDARAQTTRCRRRAREARRASRAARARRARRRRESNHRSSAATVERQNSNRRRSWTSKRITRSNSFITTTRRFRD